MLYGIIGRVMANKKKPRKAKSSKAKQRGSGSRAKPKVEMDSLFENATPEIMAKLNEQLENEWAKKNIDPKS